MLPPAVSNAFCRDESADPFSTTLGVDGVFAVPEDVRAEGRVWTVGTFAKSISADSNGLCAVVRGATGLRLGRLAPARGGSALSALVADDARELVAPIGNSGGNGTATAGQQKQGKQTHVGTL